MFRLLKTLLNIQSVQGQLQAIDRSQAVIEFDLKGNILTANSNFLKVLGYQLHEIKGQHHRIFVSERIRNSPEYQRFWATLSSGEYFEGQFERIAKDGSTRWIQATYNPIKNIFGRPYKVVKYALDVTQSSEGREQINQTLEQALDAVVTIDENNNVIFYNPAAERFWGYTRDEVIGKNVKMLVPRMHQAGHDQYVNSNRQTGQNKIVGTSREVPVECKDGSLKWGNLSLSKVRLGSKTLYTAFVRDVTEEVARREKMKTLSLVADNTDNSVVITGPEGLIEYVNPGFERMTGYTFQDVAGKKPGSFLQGKGTDQGTVQRIRERLAAQQPFYDEILNYHRDGTPYWISLAINPVFNSAGKLEKFISIQANITATKQNAVEFNLRLGAIDKNSLVFDFDRQGQLTYFNQNAQQAYARAHVEKPTLLKVLTNDQVQSLMSGESIAGEFNFGTEQKAIWAIGSFNGIPDINGQIIKTVFYGADNTIKRDALNKLIASLRDFAEGDLRNTIQGEFDEEFNGLRDTYNASLAQMTTVIAQVREATDAINTAAREIAMGNTDLSQRTEQQASSLEETASSMEELT
ncbi:PAS domain S-box protein, partial [Parvibium lacunae]